MRTSVHVKCSEHGNHLNLTRENQIHLDLPNLRAISFHDISHIIMSPLEFLQGLAAFVPLPRLNLIRFHSVLAPNAKLCAEITPDGPITVSDITDDKDQLPQLPAVRMSWARLLKRVFDIGIEHCPHCGGTLKIIAVIEQPAVITKILEYLSLPTRAPPRAPARAFDFFEIA